MRNFDLWIERDWGGGEVVAVKEVGRGVGWKLRLRMGVVMPRV